MFKSLKNIETAFQLTRLLAIIVLIVCGVVIIYVKYSSDKMIAKEREKIYVLDKGKSLMLALSQDMSQNRPAEAHNHVRMFHELFFTLSPDNSALNHNIQRALYLADRSAYDLFNDIKEEGYYRRLISANILQRIQVDSIKFNFENYPYEANTYAQQFITRGSNVTTRNLITTCYLENTGRSENNPHGFLIIEFKVIENQELSREKR
ncbi:MAG: conjugative transposon protein TraK [Prevotellaceae bacterium]|jgi:conjugative transposon TraK protein|nr:conjugative transposon protein TraK [Prevotellaceae bacterium]